jgi:acetolactate synthase small subunit
MMPRAYSLVLHHRPGALDRVIGLFRRNGCTLVTLTFSSADDPTLDVVSLTAVGGNVDRAAQQLVRLVDVVRVTDLAESRAARPADSEHPPFESQADGHFLL